MSEKSIVVGDMVHWYPSGRVDCPPHAAMVLEINNRDMLTLNVYHPDTGQAAYRRNVWPLGHKSLIDNPSLASKHGAWSLARPQEQPEPEAASVASEKPKLMKKEPQPA